MLRECCSNFGESTIRITGAAKNNEEDKIISTESLSTKAKVKNDKDDQSSICQKDVETPALQSSSFELSQ